MRRNFRREDHRAEEIIEDSQLRESKLAGVLILFVAKIARGIRAYRKIRRTGGKTGIALKNEFDRDVAGSGSEVKGYAIGAGQCDRALQLREGQLARAVVIRGN